MQSASFFVSLKAEEVSDVAPTFSAGLAIASPAERRAIMHKRLKALQRPRAKDEKQRMQALFATDCCFVVLKDPFEVPDEGIVVLPYPLLVQEIQDFYESTVPNQGSLHDMVQDVMRCTQDTLGRDSLSRVKRAGELRQRLSQFETLLDRCPMESFALAIAPGQAFTFSNFLDGACAGFDGQPEMGIAPRCMGLSLFVTNSGYCEELAVFTAGFGGDRLKHALLRLERYVYLTLHDASDQLHLALHNVKLAHDTAMLIGSVVPQPVQNEGLLLFDKLNNPNLPPDGPSFGSDMHTKQELLKDFLEIGHVRGLVMDRTHARTPVPATVLRRLPSAVGPHESHLTEAERERGSLMHMTTENLVEHQDLDRGATLALATPGRALQDSDSLDAHVASVFAGRRQAYQGLCAQLDGRMRAWLVTMLAHMLPTAFRSRGLVALSNGTVGPRGDFQGVADTGPQLPDHAFAVKYLPQPYPRTTSAQVLDAFKDPFFLPTSSFNKIVGDQNWTEATVRNFLFMLGRTRFPVGAHDNLQVTLLLQGVAGCGKSTFVLMLEQLLQPRDVASLMTRAEGTFGLRWMAELFVAIGSDLGADWRLEAGDFLMMVSGDVGSFAQKYKGTAQLAFGPQMFLCTNVFIDFLKSDTGMNYIRRVALFLMETSPVPRDPSLQARFLQNDTPTMLVKMLKVYFEDMKRVAGKGSFWRNVASKQLGRDFRTEFVKQANPLEDFLRSNFLHLNPLVEVKVRCIERDPRFLSRLERALLNAEFIPFQGNAESLNSGGAPQFGYQIQVDTELAPVCESVDDFVTFSELNDLFGEFCKTKDLRRTVTTVDGFMERFVRYGVKSVSSSTNDFFIGFRRGTRAIDASGDQGSRDRGRGTYSSHGAQGLNKKRGR